MILNQAASAATTITAATTNTPTAITTTTTTTTTIGRRRRQQQDLGDGQKSIERRVMQRRVSPNVDGVFVGGGGASNEDGGDVGAVALAGEMKRRPLLRLRGGVDGGAFRHEQFGQRQAVVQSGDVKRRDAWG